MNIYFIRHGKTQGNAENRYIGTTDESILKEEYKNLYSYRKPNVDMVYVSPMKRCMETANVIFPTHAIEVVDNLTECDFGEFEYKNFDELQHNRKYQEWIKSNGSMGFPGGESIKAFKKRSVECFDIIIWDAISKGYEGIAFVVHGGTIMSILEEYSMPHRDYYDWQLKNAEAYVGSISNILWRSNKCICNISKYEG